MEEIIVIFALILLNGVFSMSEIALISARKTSLQKDINNGSISAKIALKLANKPDEFLSTVQIGITSIGILTGIYSGDILADDFSNILINWGLSVNYSHALAQGIIVVAVTYITILIGELLPKRIGMSSSEKVAKMVARPMYMLSTIVSPFVYLLSKSNEIIFKMLGISISKSRITEEEIKLIIQEGKEEGEVQEVEQNIMERVFFMGDLKVNSIMTHRSEMMWFDVDMRVEHVQDVLGRKVFGVYPVASGNLDCVEGVVLLKDLILTINKPNFSLSNIIRPAVFFYEGTNVYKVLEQMKINRTSYALICDEFGICQGIVTLKDIMEGLVGNVDNIDEDFDIVKRVDEDGWLIDGQCLFINFLEYFDSEKLYNANKYNTVAGVILDKLEHIPQIGEKVTWESFDFEIVDMDGIRIDKVLVKRTSRNVE